MSLLLLAALALTQAQGRPARNDDIVVEALLPPNEKLPTTQKQATANGLGNRKLYENSQRVAKCAMRLPVDRLRAAIDGDFNSARQREAQAWLIRRTTTCNADSQVMARTFFGSSSRAGAVTSATTSVVDSQLSLVGAGPSSTELSAAGSLVYDYGALLENAIVTYAPDLSLTLRETSDPVVQARFNVLEVPRNKDRQIADYRYFEVAVCMVRLQPQLATRMLSVSPGSLQQARIQGTMINNARACVSNAKRVYVDPTQFRIYIIDALYRWVLAARGVTSLLPGDGPTSASR